MRVGPYELVAEVGRGGLGVVFRARTGAGEVAIKLLRQRAPRLLARFARERELLRSLGEAEGFVPLLDAGEDPVHGPYLVMPYLGGGTLRDRLRQGPLPPGEALRLGLELAESMARAHARGIVHRDLKPENVLFAPYGRALIGDLGTAKLLEESVVSSRGPTDLSRTGELRGTFGYMAPEQADAKHAGPAADVFALGAILYECLAGRPAFLGEGPMQVAERVERGERDPLAPLVPGAPPWLVEIVEQALATDPGRRFPDAAALAQALVSRTAMSARPTRSLALAAGAVLLVGVGLAGALLLARRPAPPLATPPPPPAVPPPAVPPPAPAVADPPVAPAGDPPGPTVDPQRKDPGTVQHARTLADQALAREQAGDHAAARELATQAIAHDPQNVTAWHVRSAARDNLGDHRGAIEDATRVIALAPDDYRGWHVRGAARQHLGQLEGALADDDRALELAPKNALLWANRAATLCNLGRAQEAVTSATRALELDGELGGAWSTRGAALNNLGEYERARQDLNRAVELLPHDPRPWATRSFSCVRLKLLEEALSDAERAIALDPTFVDGWLRRAKARSLRGDHAGAAADYDRALTLTPGNPALHGDRGLARERAGDIQGAIADFERALRDAPPGARWRDMIAEHLSRLRR